MAYYHQPSTPNPPPLTFFILPCRYNNTSPLSGGQKVKVVLGAGLWNLPHIVILDEPTNFLDRDSLGALATAIKAFQGNKIMMIIMMIIVLHDIPHLLSSINTSIHLCIIYTHTHTHDDFYYFLTPFLHSCCYYSTIT